MHRGYVKLWRKMEDSAVFADEYLLRLAVWCLFRAARQKRFVTVSTGRGQAVVELHPGQLVFGRHSTAKELKWKPSTTWKRLQRLASEPLKFVTIKPDKHFSIVTVCNWPLYQGEHNSPVTPISDKQGTGKEQASDTNKNVKKDKKEEEEPPPSPKPDRRPKTKPEQHRIAVGGCEIPLLLQTPEFMEAWDSWNRHRAETKKWQTGESIRLQLEKCAKIGIDRAIAMIKNSIEKSYTGLYEDRSAKPHTGGKPKTLKDLFD